MRTFETAIPTDYAPDIREILRDSILKRKDVIGHSYSSTETAFSVITETDEMRFDFYTDHDSIIWTCNMYMSKQDSPTHRKCIDCGRPIPRRRIIRLTLYVAHCTALAA